MSEFTYLQCMERATESASALCAGLCTDDGRVIDAPMRDLETALRRGASPVAIWGRWASWLCAELVVRGVMREVPELERLAVEASGNVSGLRATDGVASKAFVAAASAVDLHNFRENSETYGRLFYAQAFLWELGAKDFGICPFSTCRVAIDGPARDAFTRQAAEMFSVACREAPPADHRR